MSKFALYGMVLQCFFFSILFANEGSAQKYKSIKEVYVTIDFNNDDLLSAFAKIEAVSDLHFAFNKDDLQRDIKLNKSYKNKSIYEVLLNISQETRLRFQQVNHVINVMVIPEQEPIGEESIEINLQAITVKGKVTDDNNVGLPGVNVLVKGTTIGTVTDFNGDFTIDAPDENATLIFSFIGYVSQEISINGRTTINVALKTDAQLLDELVVVAYGEQKKETLTGSVSTVNMADMETPVRSLTNALAGKVAGIISMQTSGEPGYDNANFTIRGIGTFTGNTSPLIIIDGVQRDDANSTYAGAYNNIDPEDIASISLLKDASATAVYGAKGANGVLIITTKRGKAGKPQISVKVETGVSGLTNIPEMIDGVTYMQLYNEARKNMEENPVYSDEIIQKTASGLDPYLYPNISWTDAIYKDWAQMYNANVNVTGGGETMRYYVSMSFYDQEGSYKVSDIAGYNPNINFKRYDFRSNVDVDLTSTTELSLNLAAMLVNSRYPGVSASNIWYSAYATNPISFPIQYPNGKWAGPMNNGGTNPYNVVQNSGYTTEFRPTVQSIFTLKQDLNGFIKGLSAMGRFSFDSYSQNNNARTGNNDLWYAGSRDGNGELVFTQTRYGQDFLGYSQSSSAERTMYLEANINYNREFGNHTLGGLLLYNMRNRIQSTAGSVIGSIPYRNQGLAGRIMYGYDEKYLAEINAGYTGSENFAAGSRFGFFPSISAGWVISKESFFNSLSEYINLLKLRASHGLVGNDQIGGGSRFPYLTQINGSTGATFGMNPIYYGGISEDVLGVENLTWETSTKTNIGLEVGLWDKLNIIVEAYQDKRKNILIARQSISPIAGYSSLSIYANMGEMDNRGIDGSLEYSDHFGRDVSLRLFSNFTYSRNEIVFQDEPMRKYMYQQATGQRYGEFTGYVSEGLFVDQTDLNESPDQTFGITRPGDIKYSDLNNDGIIDASDWTYLDKSSFPSWSYGAGFTIGYKKFDLSLFFQGIADVGIMANGSHISGNGWGVGGVGVVPFTGMGQYPGNVLANVTSRWTEENPRQDVDYPRLSIANQSDNNYQGSTWWLKDGSFTRLKEASLGYTVDATTKSPWSSLYFYLSGQNLLTFSKFKLWDPELGSNGATYPPARTITFGIRAQF